MKKLLLGSTALMSAVALASGASAAEPLKVWISGYYQSFIILGDWDNTSSAKMRNDIFKQEAEIHFNGRTQLDNGLIVGFRVELEGYTSGDQIDESYVFFAGDWGRVEFGGTDDVDRKMVYGAPSVLPGHGFGTHNIFSSAPVGSRNDAGRAGGGPSQTATTSSSNNDVNRFSYFTPRFGGLQLGVSYSPEFQPGLNGNACGAIGGSSVSFGSCTKKDVGQWQHALTGAANYLQKFDNVDLALFGAVFYADPEVKNGAYGKGLRQADWWSWAAGAQVGFQGFTIGGGFGNDNNGAKGSNDTWWWTGAVSYKTGPWGISGGWWHGQRKESYAAGSSGALAGENGKDKFDYLEVGVSYLLGPGITVAGGVNWNLYDGQTKDERADSWQFILGTALTF